MEGQGRFEKAARIRTNNLGRKKLDAARARFEGETVTVFNRSINELLEKRAPREVAVENLDIRGPAKNKARSRTCSLWQRGLLAERLEFKLWLGGSQYTPVNPAFSSQTCVKCDYVSWKNRNGDKFQCLVCGYVDCADRVGAFNCHRRVGDPEITLHTSVAEVLRILERRYAERSGRLVGEGVLKSLPTVAAGPELACPDMAGAPGANGNTRRGRARLSL